MDNFPFVIYCNVSLTQEARRLRNSKYLLAHVTVLTRQHWLTGGCFAACLVSQHGVSRQSSPSLLPATHTLAVHVEHLPRVQAQFEIQEKNTYIVMNNLQSQVSRNRYQMM